MPKNWIYKGSATPRKDRGRLRKHNIKKAKKRSLKNSIKAQKEAAKADYDNVY